MLKSSCSRNQHQTYVNMHPTTDAKLCLMKIRPMKFILILLFVVLLIATIILLSVLLTTGKGLKNLTLKGCFPYERWWEYSFLFTDFLLLSALKF